MIGVRQFRYGTDNLGYLLFGKREAAAVDGGAVADIMEFVRDRGLELKYVTHTHGHPDHTTGFEELLNRSGALFLDHCQLPETGGMVLDGDTVEVIATPGHTDDSVTFVAGGALITGDTLFNGTVGNCFSGDLASFYRSLKKLLAFPDESVVYAGHDYVRESMRFARALEPENADIDGYLKRYRARHVRSTLADERRVNPYLRFNERAIVAILTAKGLPVDDEYDRFRGLMSLE